MTRQCSALDELPRATLLHVALETMHVGHLLDRALMPQVFLATRDVDTVDRVAIDVSCLVRPIAGDKIMYTRDPEGGCYILAILERFNGSDALLSFQGDVKVESKKGNVAIAAASGIDLATESAIAMRASEVNVSAVNGRLNVLDFQATGDTFTGSLNRVHLISDAVDVVAQRVTQHLKSCYRWVEEIEHITAGQMIHKVSNLFSVRERHTAITAKDDVKIDGERLHLG